MTMSNLFLGVQFYSCLAAGCFFFPNSAKGALPDADSHEAYSLRGRGTDPSEYEEPVGYQMLYSTTPDFKSPVALLPADGEFNGDAATWTTTWDGKIPDGAMNGGFYRLRAVR